MEKLLKRSMRSNGLTFKQAVNEALRRGLKEPPAATSRPYVQPTFNLGMPLVDLTPAHALAGELEDRVTLNQYQQIDDAARR